MSADHSCDVFYCQRGHVIASVCLQGYLKSSDLFSEVEPNFEPETQTELFTHIIYEAAVCLCLLL